VSEVIRFFYEAALKIDTMKTLRRIKLVVSTLIFSGLFFALPLKPDFAQAQKTLNGVRNKIKAQ